MARRRYDTVRTRLVRKGRVVGAGLVSVATVIVAAQDESIPHWVRLGSVGVLVVTGCLAVPATKPISKEMVKADHPEVAPQIERLTTNGFDR